MLLPALSALSGQGAPGPDAAATGGEILGATPAYSAWIDGLIAEGEERVGDWPAAEAHYRSALEAVPKDTFLPVAYADFLLDRDRPREVLSLLADHIQSDTAFLRLALATIPTGSDQTSRYTWIMAARFEALRLRGSEYFGREESRFALRLQHEPRAALDLALRNWQLQRRRGMPVWSWRPRSRESNPRQQQKCSSS